ncbi:MAG: hypothetical protein ACJ72N_26535 [Labedaea sp.]
MGVIVLDRLVTFVVGIFDLFAYTIPGALYLAGFGYLAVRTGAVEPAAVRGVPDLVLAIVVVLVSYLLGYLAYPIGALLNRIVPQRRERLARKEFVRRVPAAKGRPFVAADPFLLLSGIQLQDKDVAIEVLRLRAAGLMLRNAAPALLLGFLVAVVEVFTSHSRWFAAVVAVLLASGSVSLLAQSRRLGYWASLKTLELSFWMPGVDERCRGEER